MRKTEVEIINVKTHVHHIFMFIREIESNGTWKKVHAELAELYF